MDIGSKRLFIFDLDGTLVDAYTAIFRSLNFTRKKFGYAPVAFETAKNNVGNGDKNFIAVFFPLPEVDKALAVYRKHHQSALPRYVRIKPFARGLLSLLRKKGKLMAIASNRPAAYTDIIVRSLKIKHYFDYIVCADEIKSLKPHPKILREVLKMAKLKKKQAVFIGDMNIDMETAKRAAMDAVFVVGGSSSVEDVEHYKNKKTAQALKDIKGFLISGKDDLCAL
ncbi:MAG: HAD family hydrolase [Candidatus Omnitrophica bacterium]|nr:HAD family hydrolase [Candidatus Omnitrophota bacterium]MCG2704239.1 HAD family hydrolase [Candidatus Omnitrophota bacterium]